LTTFYQKTDQEMKTKTINFLVEVVLFQ